MFLEGRVFKKGVGGALKKYLPGEGALIQGGRLFKKNLFQEGRLFEGGAYSRGALIQGNTVHAT